MHYLGMASLAMAVKDRQGPRNLNRTSGKRRKKKENEK